MSRTTHEEKVEMLKTFDQHAITEMWGILVHDGTDEAVRLFREAALDAGFELSLCQLAWSRVSA